MDLSPLLVSLKTAAASIAITFFLGLFAANIVAGIKARPLKIALDGILTLPLVLPPTVAGFLLLSVFGIYYPVGKFILEFFSVRIVFSWSATVLASFVISFPLMYRSARGAIEGVDPDIINAARTLGMKEGQIFLKITLPTASNGIASGAVLSFARGLGEFGATAMIAGNIAGRTRTLPMAIYSETAAGNMETAGRYVAIIVLFSFLVVAAMNYFTDKK